MRVNVSLFGGLVKMGYLKTREQTPKVHQLQTLSFLSTWVVETIQEAGCMHRKQSTNTCVAMTRAIAQGEDGVKAICNQTLGRKFSQWRWVSFLHKNKTNTKIPRKLNRIKHGITPTYLLLLSNFQKSRPQNLWCTKWTACMVTGTFWPKTQQMFKKEVFISFLLLYMCFFWLCEVYLVFWPHQTWNTYLVCYGPLLTLLCAHLATYSLPEVKEEVTDLRTGTRTLSPLNNVQLTFAC